MKAQSLRDKGIAATDIAKMLGVSRATVYRYLADDEPVSVGQPFSRSEATVRLSRLPAR